MNWLFDREEGNTTDTLWDTFLAFHDRQHPVLRMLVVFDEDECI
jgi:hypothetical protein